MKMKLSKKRIVLSTFLGLGLAGIVVGSSAAIIITTRNKNIDLTNKVLFNAGAGHKFVTGSSTSIVNVTKQTKLSYIPQESLDDNGGGEFVGWAKTNDFVNGKVTQDKILSPFNEIQPATSLTAVYKNNVKGSIGFHSVRFIKNGIESNITGTTSLAVIHGSLLRDVNTPSCVATAAGKYFKCWANKLTPTVEYDETLPITDDLILCPIVTSQAVVTFDKNGTDEEVEVEGKTTVVPKDNQKFGTINTPKLTWKKTGSDIKYFAGWQIESTAGAGDWADIDPQYQFSESRTVRANWIDENVANEYCFVSVDSQEGVSYEGNTSFVVLKDKRWDSFNRPIARKSLYEFKNWEYCTSNDKSVWSDFATATESTTLQAKYARIRPKMAMTIGDIAIEPKNYVACGQKTEIVAHVYPSTTSQDLSWKLYYDEAGESEIPEKYATIAVKSTEVGRATAELDIKYEFDGRSEIYLQATSTVDTTKKSNLTKFKVQWPWTDSVDCWTYITNGTNKTFYKLENICDDLGSPIYMYKFDPNLEESKWEKSGPFDRTTFGSDGKHPIFFGEKIEKIPSNFLYGCTQFNSPVLLNNPNGVYLPINITKIGDNFMYGCSSFTGFKSESEELGGFFLADIRSIGHNFMRGCTSFNQDLMFDFLGDDGIGDGFLQDCTSFNSNIKLTKLNPDMTEYKLGKIGKDFLKNCTSFNKNLTIPDSVTQIGNGFMSECKAFTSTLKVDFDASPFAEGDDNLSSSDANCALALTGCKVEGRSKATFPYGTISTTKHRKVSIDTREVSSISIVDAETPKTFKLFDRFKIGKINVTYTDGNSKTIDYGFNTSNFMEYQVLNITTEEGRPEQILVEFDGKTATYDITVTEE